MGRLVYETMLATYIAMYLTRRGAMGLGNQWIKLGDCMVAGISHAG